MLVAGRPASSVVSVLFPQAAETRDMGVDELNLRSLVPGFLRFFVGFTFTGGPFCTVLLRSAALSEVRPVNVSLRPGNVALSSSRVRPEAPECERDAVSF